MANIGYFLVKNLIFIGFYALFRYNIDDEEINMKKVVEITIDHLTLDGVGVARIDKKPIYVPNCFPLETVKVAIDYEGKRNIYGHVIEVLSANPCRVIPKCSVYNACGGCHLSFMDYSHQLQFKQDAVKRIYEEAGFKNVTVHPCVGMDNPYEYRNKVQTPVKLKIKKIVAGFYKENTHDIVPFETCHVQSKESNHMIKMVLKAMTENKIPPYDEDKKTGVVRHLLIRTADTELMLVLVTAVDSFPGRKNLISTIKKYLPQLTTIVQNINPRTTNVILGEKENILYGKGYIVDTLLSLTYKISPKSFYQINKVQTQKLYMKAIELAKLSKKDIIFDAYCGIGTIGLSAAKYVKEVVGVEIVKDAIKDAIKNAQSNHIENCQFYCDDASKFIQQVDTKFDVVFVDPPRKGCDEPFLKALAQQKPKKIVYISCNPITQAKNLAYLCKHGYTFKEVYPFDMFPQTSHVETICALILKQ